MYPEFIKLTAELSTLDTDRGYLWIYNLNYRKGKQNFKSKFSEIC